MCSAVRKPFLGSLPKGTGDLLCSNVVRVNAIHAKAKSEKKVNMVALDITNKLGNAELGLAIESEEFDTTEIFEHMKSKMPDYMIPMHVRFVKEFPHSINGKINRKELKTYFNIN